MNKTLLFTITFAFAAMRMNAQSTTTKSNSGSTTISTISTYEGTALIWSECADACYNLVEGGFTDWRMPTLAESVYYRTAFAPPDGTWGTYVWTATINENAAGLWVLMNEKDGNWDYRNYDNPNKANGCRCVR
jgi:hypothetical protein